MPRFIALLQLVLALILLLFAIVTLVNMLFIVFRPETISVVNVLVGQTVLIVCLLALSRVLYKRGRQGLQQLREARGIGNDRQRGGS